MQTALEFIISSLTSSGPIVAVRHFSNTLQYLGFVGGLDSIEIAKTTKSVNVNLIKDVFPDIGHWQRISESVFAYVKMK